MSGVDLEQEMAVACAAVRQIHLDGLRALGVSINTIADMGLEYFPFGVTAAEPVGAGFYQPGEGEPHLVLPVLENRYPVDLCAFQGAQPDTWHLRVGVGWCLGYDALYAATPIHLFDHPLNWLRGAGDGICVLDWASPEIRLLGDISEVTCSDARTVKLLHGALSRPARAPKISVAEVR
ncbi:MAG: hypothetical protein JWO81_2150 [Alphaproteobacteria bacterium]|nr:hypothetical protein [Alphaproteobacteria bacterium]